ncbi:MAG: c-type cytochrome [Pirellulaceae bacterium]
MLRLSPLVLVFVIFVPFALGADEADEATRAKDARRVKALLRLENPQLSDDAKTSVLRYLQTKKGTDEFLSIVGKFQLKEAKDDLVRLAVEDAEGTLGVEAVRLLMKLGLRDSLAKGLADKDEAKSAKLAAALGLLGDPNTNALLLPLVTSERSVGLRAATVMALGRNLAGQKELLSLVQAEKLPADLRFSAANALLTSSDAAVKAAAAKYLQLPATADAQPLPPVAELVKQSGSAEEGRKVYMTVGTCAKCHKVQGEGKEVGPDLSEIGSKLSKEALYVSILDPSAGISHNYETHLLLLEDGTSLSGILVSDTEQEVSVKTAEAIIRKIPRDEITAMKKQPVSLMPADLQKSVTAKNLVDVVEFLTTLKKP